MLEREQVHGGNVAVGGPGVVKQSAIRGCVVQQSEALLWRKWKSTHPMCDVMFDQGENSWHKISILFWMFQWKED